VLHILGDVPARDNVRQAPMRILCLGNELLADDSLGSVVAEHIRQFAPPQVEVISTPEAGFHLLDYVLDTASLVVIDTVITGTAPPGTIYELHEEDFRAPRGGSPHYIGLQETLCIARSLHLSVAESVVVLAVEAADCSTLGGAMHPAVREAMPVLLDKVRKMIESKEKSNNPPGDQTAVTGSFQAG
jgi:hydrogenase maturation protease